MKPWQSEELMPSSSVGAVSCGGVQNTVSRSAWSPSASVAGAQCAVAASAPERQRIVGIALRAHAARRELDLVRPAR